MLTQEMFGCGHLPQQGFKKQLISLMIFANILIIYFLENILFQQTVIVAILTAILLLWTTIHKRKEDIKENKKVTPIPVVISTFSAVILIINAIYSQHAANSLQVKNKNQEIELRAKNDALQAKSNQLEAKSNQIIDSTGEIRKLQADALTNGEKLRLSSAN